MKKVRLSKGNVARLAYIDGNFNMQCGPFPIDKVTEMYNSAVTKYGSYAAASAHFNDVSVAMFDLIDLSVTRGVDITQPFFVFLYPHKQGTRSTIVTRLNMTAKEFDQLYGDGEQTTILRVASGQLSVLWEQGRLVNIDECAVKVIYYGPACASDDDDNDIALEAESEATK